VYDASIESALTNFIYRLQQVWSNQTVRFFGEAELIRIN